MIKTEMPSLMFRVSDRIFAVDTTVVSGIMQLPEEVTPMPDYPDYVKGVIRVRDEIVPILQMRKILNLPTAEDEYTEVAALFDKLKKDHEMWVSALVRCVKDGAPFPLSTDPHQCALGRWYDSYKPANQALGFHLRKLEQPHAALHHTAVEVLKHLQDGGNEQSIDAALRRASNIYMPQVLNLLDQSKDIFKNQYREMCISLTNNEVIIGLLVDDVLSVEEIREEGHIQEGGFIPKKGRLVTGVVHSAQVDGEILVLNEKQLFEDFINAQNMAENVNLKK